MFIVPFAPSRRALSWHRHFGLADVDASLRSPSLDVAETETAYTVTLDLPGVSKGDVEIAIDGRRVSIQAQSRGESDKKDGDRLIYSERVASNYARSFMLPVEVNPADADAKLDNGVLTLTLPKRGAVGSSRITVR